MTYVAKNASKYTGILKNGDNKKTRFASDVTKPRQAYSHEQTQDSSPSTDSNLTPTSGSDGTTLQVSTHQLVPKSQNTTGQLLKPTANNDFDDILTMATTKTTSKTNPDALLTINQIMSTPTIETNVHESYYERTNYGLEAFVHKVKIGNYEYEVESEDGEDDFNFAQVETEETYEKFDYSAYKEEPVVESNTPIDLLDDVTFLMDRATLSDAPEEEEPKPLLPKLDTVQDLMSFHQDPQAELATVPVPDSRTLTQADFELTESDKGTDDPNTSTFSYTSYKAETEQPVTFDFSNYLDDYIVHDDEFAGVEESKEEVLGDGSPQEMMKPPFDHVPKPSPTKTKIVPNEDGSKFVFKQDSDNTTIEHDEPPELEAIPPPPEEEPTTQVFDYTQYLDSDFPTFSEDNEEPKFYEKPALTVNTAEENTTGWTPVATKRKSKKPKQSVSGICSFLSPKSYVEAALSSSSGSAPTSQSDQQNPRGEQDFHQAGSD
jgi:hypothetical protein